MIDDSMPHLKFNPELIQIKPISALKPGDKLLNLGEVLEIEESPEIYAVIIYRLTQKQVFKFERDTNLYLINEDQAEASV
ncbi:hypothetical protein ABIE26_001466 [Pedobacter africanus]|uniref:Uncharacterized protein n=1 Tax=Pedobacter africanus TaxID=151894 RepID=A0ACC6KS77_9SPHI|nr:hypothetical protein [Pedobacter africanus]MDR6782045.1 hypothetical protein [Pedobacter africanus]